MAFSFSCMGVNDSYNSSFWSSFQNINALKNNYYKQNSKKKYKKALKRVLPKLRKIDLNIKPLLYQSGQCVTPLKTVI